MSTNEIQQPLLDAINLLSKKAVRSSGATITIKAEVIEMLFIKMLMQLLI